MFQKRTGAKPKIEINKEILKRFENTKLFLQTKKAINKAIPKRQAWYFDKKASDKNIPNAIHKYDLSSLLKISLIDIYVAPATEKFKEASGITKRPPEKKKNGEKKQRIDEQTPASFE